MAKRSEGRPVQLFNGSSSRESVMFTMSASLKEALDQFAGQANQARAQVIREAIAAHIGYDLSKEPKAGRPTKYGSPEERKAAQRLRNKAKRELVARLLAEHEAQERQAELEALDE